MYELELAMRGFRPAMYRLERHGVFKLAVHGGKDPCMALRVPCIAVRDPGMGVVDPCMAVERHVWV